MYICINIYIYIYIERERERERESVNVTSSCLSLPKISCAAAITFLEMYKREVMKDE